MSDFHLEYMLEKYLEFFSIKVSLNKESKDFLKSDLLLLRIYCEVNTGKDLGTGNDIYKDELYEKYLLKIANKIGTDLNKTKILPTLFKLIQHMLDCGDFSSMMLTDYDKEEILIIESLVEEDVILRRELPEEGLLKFGAETVNFTYDDLRDFLISFYLINGLVTKDFDKFKFEPKSCNRLTADCRKSPIIVEYSIS